MKRTDADMESIVMSDVFTNPPGWRWWAVPIASMPRVATSELLPSDTEPLRDVGVRGPAEDDEVIEVPKQYADVLVARLEQQKQQQLQEG